MKTESAAVREQICRGISVSGLSPDHSYLTYAGILPVDFPHGTRGVILPDLHAPAHNRRLMWGVYQFLAAYQPHVLISIGDLADIFGFSRHPAPLRAVINPMEEIRETRALWDELHEVSGCDRSYVIIGNHEDRIYRYLQDLAPRLGGILNPHTRESLSFHSLLGYTRKDRVTFLYGTDERGGFEGGLLINNDLQLHHGILVRPKPGASPLADMDRWLYPKVHGHTHRMGAVFRDVTASERNMSGMLRGFELGMLVDMNHSYMAYARHMWPNWHPGFATFTVHKKTVHLQQIPIVPMRDASGRERLSFVWDGEVFTESDI